MAVLLGLCGFKLHVNLSTAGFIELLAVVLTALRFGFWAAIGPSIMAVACLDYLFAPPLLSFHVADPQNWVALTVFAVTALIVSHLSDQVQDQMNQSLLHQHNAEKLYQLSRSVLVLNRQEPAGQQIASLIKNNIGVDAVTIFDATLAAFFAAGTCTKEDEQLARNTYLLNKDSDDAQSHDWQRVMRSGSNPIGAIVMRGIDLNPRMADAIASLVSAAFERVRSFEKESRAEAARQAEQLRTTVLDGLAHDFKTPLTVILTSASGLLEMNSLSPAEAELVGLIDEHATRLNALTTHLLRMAKLDSADIQLRLQEVAVGPFVREVVDDCSQQLCGHPVQEYMESDDLVISADRQLLAITVTELIVNAAKYSNGDSPIIISANQRDNRVVISVHNDGPTIDFAERERIFERFYRSPATKRRASGSGIGLSIAKRTAEAHRGSLSVSSDLQTGTTFFLGLPVLTRTKYVSLAD